MNESINIIKILIKLGLLLIAVSLAADNYVTSCIWLSCATCTTYISTNKILSRKHITLIEKNSIEGNVNTKNLLMLVLICS